MSGSYYDHLSVEAKQALSLGNRIRTKRYRTTNRGYICYCYDITTTGNAGETIYLTETPPYKCQLPTSLWYSEINEQQAREGAKAEMRLMVEEFKKHQPKRQTSGLSNNRR